MEEGSDCQIKQGFRANFGRLARIFGSEDRVAAFLQPVESARVIITHQTLDHLEGQGVCAIESDEVRDPPVDVQEVSNDFDHSGSKIPHSSLALDRAHRTREEQILGLIEAQVRGFELIGMASTSTG